MRKPEPFFRKFDGWWYVTLRVNGRRQQFKLAQGKENRAKAYDEYFQLVNSHSRSPVSGGAVSSLSVLVGLDSFLAFCIAERSPETVRIYRYFLESFGRSIRRDLTVHEVKPKHVTEWLLAKKWSRTTKNNAVGAIRRAFHWLRNEGHIDQYPLHGLKAPRKSRREVIISDEEYKQILSSTDKHFGDLLSFLRLTGARPQEARAVAARHVDLMLRRIVFPPSEAKGKEYPRVIYLNDNALQIVTRLIAKYPEGPIFRNRLRRPWSKDSIRCRFRRLKVKLGKAFCAYHFRHTFATNALQRLDPITVSVLLGHSDASMLARTYQHLAKNPVAMLDAAKLKIEINTREHQNLHGLKTYPFEINSDWHQAKADIVSFEPEELFGTKLRALLQRHKNRDLFDLNEGLLQLDLDLTFIE